jgi:hypothetical protein
MRATQQRQTERQTPDICGPAGLLQNATMTTARKQPPKPPAHRERALPAWAVHIASSITAGSEGEATVADAEGDPIFHFSLPSGLTLLKAVDVCVIALPEEARDEHVSAALRELNDALNRGATVAAIAFPPALGPAPPEYVNYLADLGIAIVRDNGETALIAATEYVRRVLGLRSKARQHLASRPRSS